MKTIFVVLCFFASMMSSCRTTSARSKSYVKSSPDCDPRNLLSELHPGGLFASTRIIYNQVHVQPGVIHPDMTEQDASGSLGLYHTYVPTSANLPVIDSLNEIQSQSLSVNVKEPNIIDSQTMSFEGAETVKSCKYENRCPEWIVSYYRGSRPDARVHSNESLWFSKC